MKGFNLFQVTGVRGDESRDAVMLVWTVATSRNADHLKDERLQHLL